MSFMPFNKTLISAKRYQEILSVLVRHGFENFVSETGLEHWLGFGKTPKESHPSEDGSVHSLPRAVRIRRVIEDLGPTFIKIGQVLSTRHDLIPSDWVEEFRKLQNRCPQVDFAIIKEILIKEFDDDQLSLFSYIEETALAAASLAQVHRVILADGRTAVVKVLRPGVRNTVEADIEVMSKLAQFVERHFAELGYSPVAIVNEFSRELKREVHLKIEARSTDRLRNLFADDERIDFPEVYWECSTDNVLTMEEITGQLLADITPEAIDEHERIRVVSVGADAVFKQCFEFGFFHADPHPGNIFLRDDGSICFIDCGMTGYIDRKTSEQLADLVSGVASADLDRVLSASGKLANIHPSLLEDRSFRADAWDFVSQFENTRLDRLDVGTLLERFFELLGRYKIRCPSDIVFLIKAITTIEGVGERFAPSFDIINHVKPHIENLLRRRYGFGALRKRLRRSFLRYAELAEDLPFSLQSLLAQIRENKFSIKLEHRGLDRLTRTVEHASRNIAYSLIIAALLVGSSILILADAIVSSGQVYENLGFFGLMASVLLVVVLFIANRRSK